MTPYWKFKTQPRVAPVAVRFMPLRKDVGRFRLEKENRELRAELLEQARLLGMGSEREAALLGRLAQLERDNLKLQHELAALKASAAHGA